MSHSITSLLHRLPTNGDYPRRAASKVDTIVVHHAADKPRKDGNWHKQIAGYASYHIKKHGWRGIGYHYVIAPDGQVFKCNRELTVCNHAKGANTRSIGICLIGNFTDAPPPAEQLAALRWLCDVLRQAYPIGRILAHRDVQGSSTACPGKAFTGLAGLG